MIRSSNATLEHRLAEVYSGRLAAQAQRYRRATALFMKHFGEDEGLPRCYRAPGRVNLIGEHTDYNAGYVMPAALERDLLLLARPRADRRLMLANTAPGFAPIEIQLDHETGLQARNDWGDYARGLCNAIRARLAQGVDGLDILIDAEGPLGLPRGAGLSSSSALTVALALAMADAIGWQPDEVSDLSELCREAEWFVGTRGGIMDQLCSLTASRGQVLFIDCRRDTDGRYAIEKLDFPSDLRLLVVDSGTRHDNTSGAFNRRVAACRAGVALLSASRPGLGSLRELENECWHTIEPELPETISPGELARAGVDLGDIPGLSAGVRLHVRARCRHVWQENRRVRLAREALRSGNLDGFGTLLFEAHTSAAGDYEISIPEIDFIVEQARGQPGVIGARLTGAGWGGCALVLCHVSAVDGLVDRMAQSFEGSFGRRPPIFVSQPGAAAGPVLA